MLSLPRVATGAVLILTLVWWPMVYVAHRSAVAWALFKYGVSYGLAGLVTVVSSVAAITGQTDLQQWLGFLGASTGVCIGLILKVFFRLGNAESRLREEISRVRLIDPVRDQIGKRDF